MMSVASPHTAQFCSDWLGSDPVFYNEYTGKVSNNINDVIDFRHLELHPEGLNNYLDFGYSAFEQTPVKGVKFLRHSSTLSTENDKINIKYLHDPVEKLLGNQTDEDNVIDLLRNTIQNWENSVEGEIVIPTSGGYDSRLLTELIGDKKRVRTFTYGLSDVQSESFEVVYARKMSEILGTRFEQIELGTYHNYFKEWDNLFGISTHAHGMYQIEFYEKVKQKVNSDCALLSGIIGDAWAGSVSISPIEDAQDVIKLGYAHHMKADSGQSLLKSEPELLHSYFIQNKEQLKDPRMRVVESMRFKIVLLCYLFKIPAHTGFRPWSPFLDMNIALAMLNLPDQRRKNRAWQVDYFKSKGLDIESMHLSHTKKNTLNKQAMYKIPVQPLNVAILREVIKPAYLERINKYILPGNNVRDLIDMLTYYPKVGGALRRMGVKDERLTAYLAYLTLKPLETLLVRRNSA